VKLNDLYEGKSIADLGNDIEHNYVGRPDFHDGTLDLRSLKLTNLTGCPRVIKGSLFLNSNLIKSFIGAPLGIKLGGHLNIASNPINSLEGIEKFVKEINGTIIVDELKINNHVLGVFRINGISLIDHSVNEKPLKLSWRSIVNKHLENPNRKMGIFECQEELIHHGFEKHALI